MSKVSKKELFELLNQRHENNPYSRLSDIPGPQSFKDIQKASQRVLEAINNNETITIVGDYDVDGVISTTIMIDFFEQLGIKVNAIIPNRFEHGYGLSAKIVEMIDEGLVITVDNGISACEATQLLNEKGIDVIITDHHTVADETPEAFAIVNPKQSDCQFPFKDICGAQVAWYFCASIKATLQKDINMGNFLDLLCVAIIADIMPMTSLNYTMVKSGLQKLQNSKRAAFIELKDLMRKKSFVSDDIGFFIAPKINSAGRMDDASVALKFLLSKNSFQAQESLDLLEELNNYRKTLQEDITAKAHNKVNINEHAVIVWGEDWHEGVIGIVASKLSHEYKKPAFVFSVKEGIAKGSARANADINLHSIISEASELLLGFGGHKNAAGLSLQEHNLEAFKEKVNQVLEKDAHKLHIEPITLGELDVSSVDLEFLNIIERFEPYGLNNSKPIFKITNANVLKYEYFGKDKNHLKIILEHDGFQFEALKFYCEKPKSSDQLDMVITVSKNEFRGKINPQFLIQNIL